MEWVQGAGGEIRPVDLCVMADGETYSQSFAVEWKSLFKIPDIWENKLTNKSFSDYLIYLIILKKLESFSQGKLCLYPKE